MSAELKPYVISSDVKGLMEGWSKRTGYQIPENDYFRGMTNDLASTLKEYYPGLEVVEEADIRRGLEDLSKYRDVGRHKNLPIISLDRAYGDDNIEIEGHIEVTRGVSEPANPGEPFGILGTMPRPTLNGEMGRDVREQLDALRTETDSPVILLDDVIFSGDAMGSIIEELEKRNRPVEKVIAGIGIRTINGHPGGIEKLMIEKGVKEVVCVREFETVVDEVCQRDFIAGVPMSGRTIFYPDGELRSAPYFLPFGDPEEWASIPPEKVKEFSAFCIDTSIMLFRKIESRSQSSVPTSAIDRLPRFIRRSGSFAKELEYIKDEQNL